MMENNIFSQLIFLEEKKVLKNSRKEIKEKIIGVKKIISFY
jgi:hypothetical protein